MKRYSVLILAVFLSFLTTTASWAGLNADINRVTPFNNFTDSLAALGKSPEQKTTIRNKRRLARSQARLKKAREANLNRSTRR